MCKKYNGWSNYETWAVNLWLDNDQYSYNEMRNKAKSSTTYELSEFIKEMI